MEESQRPYGPPAGYGPAPSYGSGYPAQGYYGQPVWQGPQETEGKAIIALVCAIGSFLLVPLLPAIAALFLARSATRDIDASGGRLTGRGLVTAARVTAWINIGLCIAVVVLAVLAFGLFAVAGASVA